MTIDAWIDGQAAAFVAKLRTKKPRQPRDAAPKKRAHPERDLQRAVVALVRRGYPRLIIAAVPNEQRGGAADAAQRARFGAARKASGVMTGFPDLLVVMPGRVLLWELKAPDGVLSPGQREAHEKLAALGHTVRVIRSVDDALADLRRHGAVP